MESRGNLKTDARLFSLRHESYSGDSVVRNMPPSIRPNAKSISEPAIFDGNDTKRLPTSIADPIELAVSNRGKPSILTRSNSNLTLYPNWDIS
jgi:hypothetical protein